MRHLHANNQVIRRQFFTRLGIILDKLNHGITQRSIARFLGVSIGSVSRIIVQGDKMPSLDMMLSIADKLNLDYSITLAKRRGSYITNVTMSGISEFDFPRTSEKILSYPTKRA